MASISMVTQFENRSSDTTKDAKMVNAYAEKINAQKVVAVKRPGLAAGTLYEAGAVQGVVTYLGVSRMVVNNKFYTSPTTSQNVTDAAGLRVDFV